MRWGLPLSWMLAAACGFTPPAPAGPPPDGVPSPDGCTTFSTQLDTCALPSPIRLDLSGVLTFNTDTGELRDATSALISVKSIEVPTLGDPVRALVATTVVLRAGARLRATGIPGFAIVATGGITLEANARIEVGSGGAGHRGDCGPAAAGNGANDSGGAAGGGGGGFGAAGGRGGNGDADGGQSMGGAAGMMAAEVPAGPIGGCPGGKGGTGEGSSMGGNGGRGGGAVYLASAVSIGIGTDGGIDAGGEGGGGGLVAVNNGDAGGGGGGSGGSIFLEAPRLRIDGILAANGGGGGEGSGNGVPGLAGAAGRVSTQAAPGGQQSQGSGASGGAGGHAGSPAGAQTTQIQNGGGGGGGGSVGFLIVRSPDAQLGTVSPEPTPP